MSNPSSSNHQLRNLGVYLDSKISLDKKVSETCKTSYFHIRALRHVWSSLTTEACKTVAVAIVGSRLDYCNSILAGTFVSNLARLQLVQNSLAPVVTQKNLVFATLRLSLLIYIGFLFVTEYISILLLSLSRFCSSSSHPISLPLFHGMVVLTGACNWLMAAASSCV